MKTFFTKRNVVAMFLVSVPIIAATISTFHLIEMFRLGNLTWMAILLGITYELGSLSIMAALTVLKYIKKSIVWLLFIILFLMQLIGNVYYTFDYINQNLKLDPTYLDSFVELYVSLIGFFMEIEPESLDAIVKNSKTILALLIGVPIPLISIGITKSLVDYLDNTKEESSAEIIAEEPLVKKQTVSEQPIVFDSEPFQSVVEPLIEPEVISENSPTEFSPESKAVEIQETIHTITPIRKSSARVNIQS
jgi:hypothetical protein